MAYRDEKREREGKKEEEAWENVSEASMVYAEERERVFEKEWKKVSVCESAEYKYERRNAKRAIILGTDFGLRWDPTILKSYETLRLFFG